MRKKEFRLLPIEHYGLEGIVYVMNKKVKMERLYSNIINAINFLNNSSIGKCDLLKTETSLDTIYNIIKLDMIPSDIKLKSSVAICEKMWECLDYINGSNEELLNRERFMELLSKSKCFYPDYTKNGETYLARCARLNQWSEFKFFLLNGGTLSYKLSYTNLNIKQCTGTVFDRAMDYGVNIQTMKEVISSALKEGICLKKLEIYYKVSSNLIEEFEKSQDVTRDILLKIDSVIRMSQCF